MKVCLRAVAMVALAVGTSLPVVRDGQARAACGDSATGVARDFLA